MRFKLDENLGPKAAAVLSERGHDVATVPVQRMSGTPDRALLAACLAEGRCLVTLDGEFGNTLLFPPRETRGIVLLRIPGRMDHARILAAVRTLADAMATAEAPGETPDRRLWIVEPGRVRVHQGASEEEE